MFTVPTVELLNKKLYEYHVQNFHCNYKDTQSFFKVNKIGFLGINKIIEDYVHDCPVYAQTSRTIHRQEPDKYIQVNGPNTRYEFDLTYLNNDLSKAFGVKYILGVIFSHKVMIGYDI